MQTDQQRIFASLANEGPEAWRLYLIPFENGEPLDGLSMDVIYHHAAKLAKNQLSLEWAEVAINAAELWAHKSYGVERENALLWDMKLRSWFISKMGSRSNHRVLDKEKVLSWIMDGLNVPVEVARDRSLPFWKNMAQAKCSKNPEDMEKVVDDVRSLRRIKQRLNVAQVLADAGELSGNPILHHWLEIRERLP